MISTRRWMQGRRSGGDTPSAWVQAFLDGSEKAAAQWELERRFSEFEANFQRAEFDRLARASLVRSARSGLRTGDGGDG